MVSEHDEARGSPDNDERRDGNCECSRATYLMVVEKTMLASITKKAMKNDQTK